MEFLRRRLDETLTFTFLLILLVLSILRDSPLIEPIGEGGLTTRTLEGFALLIAILVACRMADWRRLWQVAWEFLPALVALMAYESLKHMHATAMTVWLGITPKDGLMLAWDSALFGKTPYLWLADWGLNGHAFLAVMGSFYALYYVAPVAALAWFMLAGDMAQFQLIRRGTVIALYGGYCFYVLVPVAGPALAQPIEDPLFFQTMTSYSFLMTHFRYSFDCFPSLHTAIPWLLVLLCRHKLPSWLMIAAVIASIGVTASTIALRQHYGVDVIAGLAWALAASLIARASMPRATTARCTEYRHQDCV